MAANGGTVTVDFAVEIQKANAGITEVVNHLKGFEKQLEALNKTSQQRLKQVEDRFGGLEKVAKRVAQAFSVAVITNFAKSAADAADKLGKTADRIGITTEALRAFQIAGGEAGVGIDQTNKLLVEAQKRLGETAAGTGEAGKVIKKLGLSVSDLQKLSPDQLFLTYAEAIGKLSSRSEQLAVAEKLMGENAAESFRIIQAGAPAFNEAQQFVERFGLALSRVDIKQIEQANDAIGRVATVSQAASQRIVAGLSPAIEYFAKQLLDATGNTKDLQVAAEVFGSAAIVAFELVANAARSLQAAFFGIAAGGARVLQFLTFGDVSESFAASVDANLAKANDALLKIKSIEQIQQTVIKALEDSRAKAEQSVAEQAARDAAARATGVTLADPIGVNQEQRYEEANLAAKAAADAQREIARELTRDIEAELKKRTDAEHKAAGIIYERMLQGEAAVRAAKTQTTDLAINLLQALGTKNKAFAIAAIVLEKAVAIQRLLVQNRIAAELAFASQLIPGVPTSLATATAAKAAVLAQGYISAGLIAATGALQIADVTSGGGRSQVGSALNPAFVATSAGSAGQPGATSQRTLQLVFNGPVFNSEQTKRYIVEAIREAVDDSDVIIIGPGSRQAQELAGG